MRQTRSPLAALRRLARPVLTLPLLAALPFVVAAGCGGSSSGKGAPTASTAAPATAAPASFAPPGATTAPAPVTSSAPVTLPSGTLRALSYNVAGLPEWLSSTSPVRNIPQISPLLNAYELVLVQEDFWYSTELARDALHPFQSAPLSGYGTLVGDGLSRLAEHPFTDHRRIPWPTCHGTFGSYNDCLAAKGYSVARHTIAPGVAIDVYNLHADAGDATGDRLARAVQFDHLARYIAHYSAGQAVIVAGDTNLTVSFAADEQVLQDFMAATGLADVARTIGGLPEEIDRFLFRGSADVDLTPLTWRLADEFVNGNGAPLSDHPAIHVDFSWQRLR